MYLYFIDKDENKILVKENMKEDETFLTIKNYLASKEGYEDFKIYYLNCHKIQDKDFRNIEVIDFGSWSEFFHCTDIPY